MKKIIYSFCLTFLLLGCNNDDGNEPLPAVRVNFNFTQNWDGQPIANADFENTTYVNAANESMKLSKLNYLISDITFTSVTTGEVFESDEYNLVLVRDAQNLQFTPQISIPQGQYEVSFTFGFDDEDNDKPGGYLDLNTADSSWNVPETMGGGYHYQRIEGTFTNNNNEVTTFQFHTIRANRHESLPPVMPVELRDTSILVNLGEVTIGSNTSIEVKANIAEWFKNPITWSLNERSSILMPNFQAQLDMFENGKDVFSLGEVIQN